MPKFGLLKVAKFVGITYIVENLRTELASSTKLIFLVNDILLASLGGKHKGKTVIEVLEKESGYYSWMRNGDFSLYTKKILKEI